MSASSPVITIEVGDQSRQADVRSSLRRLYSRRVFWRAAAGMTTVLACALAALCAVAFADYGWGLPRVARIILLLLVLLVTLFVLARNGWVLGRRRTLTEVAREIEQATGSQRNALVTFAESLEKASAAESQSYMLARLERQARAELEQVDERVVAPREGAIRGALALLFMLLVIFALRLLAPQAFARETRRVLWLAGDDVSSGQLNKNVAANVNAANAEIFVDELRVRVVPPAYSGLSVEEIAGDAPVRALAGSQIEIVIHASGAVEGASIMFNGETFAMRSLGAGSFSGSFTASASGAFETRVHADESHALPAPVVRAVEVYNDAPPEARIIEPVSDQLLRSVPGAPVTLRWTARDDLGLANVALKYIKSRGEGDAAKFTNGEISIGNVSRASGREWQGAGALDLQRLDMQPGDTLVFWLEARDRRSASANNTGRSASLAIAIAGPELVKLNLSDLRPNEIGRFLLSQRAIIIHTEKLHGVRARLAKDELVRRAGDIAAEQREFKNSFNDYIHTEGAGEMEATGGVAPSTEEQVRAAEDERTEPHFHGIPEPPSASPTSVKEMTYAIRAMWDAEDALTNADTAQALKFEREALIRLKRAQVATRYVPPIVAQSKPVDLKRRYAGELAEIKTRLEKLARPRQSPASQIVRGALADVYAALNDLQETLNVPASVRSGAMARARERARAAADGLVKASGGDHAATIAEAAGQLRVVEVELARMEAGGSSDEYATRLAKPLALLTQAAANLFAIAESSTRAGSNDTNRLLPTDDARAAEYFRRLAGGK
ncbi:MAG: hypothetical protein QOH25_1867 [Acidobacteriota bacterium]|jgi:hypothetical protein|nr:hypothetical protein [Acidobacteriota bacterium]